MWLAVGKQCPSDCRPVGPSLYLPHPCLTKRQRCGAWPPSSQSPTPAHTGTLPVCCGISVTPRPGTVPQKVLECLVSHFLLLSLPRRLTLFLGSPKQLKSKNLIQHRFLQRDRLAVRGSERKGHWRVDTAGCCEEENCALGCVESPRPPSPRLRDCSSSHHSSGAVSPPGG